MSRARLAAAPDTSPDQRVCAPLLRAVDPCEPADVRRPANRLVRPAATAAGLLLTAACGAVPIHAVEGDPPTPPSTEADAGTCSGFELSLASDVNGQPS